MVGALIVQLARVQFHIGSDTIVLSGVASIPGALGKDGGAALLIVPVVGGTGFGPHVQDVQHVLKLAELVLRLTGPDAFGTVIGMPCEISLSGSSLSPSDGPVPLDMMSALA